MTSQPRNGAAIELPPLPEPAAWQWRKRQTWFEGKADECHFWSEWEALQPPYMDARDLAISDPENYQLRSNFTADQLREAQRAAIATHVAKAPAAGEVAEMLAKVADAYGHLWHVNNEPMAPIALRSPEKAAYEARKILRDMLTNEQRGEAINKIGREIEAATSPAPAVAEPAHVAKEAQGVVAVYDFLRARKRAIYDAQKDPATGLVGVGPHRSAMLAYSQVMDDLASLVAPASPAEPSEPDMRAICEALGFDPTNHHNAAKCPYCRPAPVAVTREPLTDDDIWMIRNQAMQEVSGDQAQAVFIVRSIEAHHGIAASPAGAEGAGS